MTESQSKKESPHRLSVVEPVERVHEEDQFEIASSHEIRELGHILNQAIDRGTGEQRFPGHTLLHDRDLRDHGHGVDHTE